MAASSRALDLNKFIGSVQTPYDGAAAPEQQREITNAIVGQHRLCHEIAYHAMWAWHDLQEYPTEVLQPSIVGLLFEHCFAQTLNSCDWRRGRANAHEKDTVCVPEPSHSIEIKTTSRYKCDAMHGPRSVHNALRTYLTGKKPAKVRDGYHLIVSYHLESMKLQKIRFGWLQDVDFVAHTSSLAAPRCPAHVARTRLLTLYDEQKSKQMFLN